MFISPNNPISFSDLNKIRVEKSTLTGWGIEQENSRFSALRTWFIENTAEGTDTGSIPTTGYALSDFVGRSVRLIGLQAKSEYNDRYDQSRNAALKVTFEPSVIDAADRVNNNPHFSNGSEITVTEYGTNQNIIVSSSSNVAYVNNLGSNAKWSATGAHKVQVSTISNSNQVDVDQTFYFYPGVHGHSQTTIGGGSTYISLALGGTNATAYDTGANGVDWGVQATQAGTGGNSITFTGNLAGYDPEPLAGFTAPNLITTVSPHGYTSNMQVTIAGSAGVDGLSGTNYSLNRNWYVDPASSTTFTIYEDSSLTTAAKLSGSLTTAGTVVPVAAAGGLETVQELINDWNVANPTNAATVTTGGEATIPDNQTYTLSGGEAGTNQKFGFLWSGSTVNSYQVYSKKIQLFNDPHTEGGTNKSQITVF